MPQCPRVPQEPHSLESKGTRMCDGRRLSGGLCHLLSFDPRADLICYLVESLPGSTHPEDFPTLRMDPPYSIRGAFSLIGRLRGSLARSPHAPSTEDFKAGRLAYRLCLRHRLPHLQTLPAGDPQSLAKLLGWDVPLIVVTARLRCSSCYAKDCEIQVDRIPAAPRIAPRTSLGRDALRPVARALEVAEHRTGLQPETAVPSLSARTFHGENRCAITIRLTT